MENEIKYPIIIAAVALLSLVAFNYEELAGNVILRNQPTTFTQERLNLVRTIDFLDNVKLGQTIQITYVASNMDDLIETNKEKIIIYESENKKFKKQLTYPVCKDGRSSACFLAEKSFTIPISWSKGNYRIQIERENEENDKAITEVIGRTYFKII